MQKVPSIHDMLFVVVVDDADEGAAVVTEHDRLDEQMLKHQPWSDFISNILTQKVSQHEHILKGIKLLKNSLTRLRLHAITTTTGSFFHFQEKLALTFVFLNSWQHPATQTHHHPHDQPRRHHHPHAQLQFQFTTRTQPAMQFAMKAWIVHVVVCSSRQWTHSSLSCVAWRGAGNVGIGKVGFVRSVI